MALIECPECGKAISDKAKRCPNCAYPLSSVKRPALFKFFEPPDVDESITEKHAPKEAYAPFVELPYKGGLLSEILTDKVYCYKKSKLDKNGFVQAEKLYDLSRVHTMEFDFYNHSVLYNGVYKTAPVMNGSCVVVFKSGQKVPIEISHSLLSSASSANDECVPALELAEALAKLTFELRYFKYMHQLKLHGYFSYNSAAFYKDGTVVKGKRKTNIKKYEVVRSRCSNSLGERILITVPKSKAAGLLNVISDKALSLTQDVEISTRIDRDVIFAVLDKAYGVRWDD